MDGRYLLKFLIQIIMGYSETFLLFLEGVRLEYY